jgi:hypothetical protein
VTHEEVYARLGELATLHPSGTDEAALMAHVAECAICSERVDTIRRMERLLSETPRQIEVPSGLHARINAIPSVHPQTPASRRRSRRPIAIGAAVVAAAASTLAIAVLWPRDFDASRSVVLSAPTARVAARVEFSAGSGPNQQVRLVARGLPEASYVLRFVDARREFVAASFRPDADGDCEVVGAVPRNVSWTRVMITTAGDGPAGAEPAASADL